MTPPPSREEKQNENEEQRETEMNGITEARQETPENEYDPEAEIIMEILRQINAELDEIADKLDEIGTIG